MEKNKSELLLTKEEEFSLTHAESMGGLYFPLMSENGFKSAITPDLRGDLKTDQNHFVLEPASILNLSESLASRNFWCDAKDENGRRYIWSATGCSHEQMAKRFTDRAEEVTVSGGFLWHRTERVSKDVPLRSGITSFIPYDQNIELHIVTVENTGDADFTLSFTAAVPIYGRSADNLRDHRHVTSLLHRIAVQKSGVFVCPTMSFDERGHKLNDEVYYVAGIDEDGKPPVRFYPTIDSFAGEEGDLFSPKAIYEKAAGETDGYTVNGQEAMGGLGFEERTLKAGESVSYLIGIGMGKNCLPASLKEAQSLLEKTKSYWKNRVRISFATGDQSLDAYLRWIAFQPELRRVFGCSFLPHHDYGRGGRGWRDLWQDCLGLLLMNPTEVRSLLLSNCGGIRLDGTNATIIGSKPGEFKADRNAIPRVWMDHGMWPMMTVKLYLDETGDFTLLDEQAPYFKDTLCMRGDERDESHIGDSTIQRTESGETCTGSVLEHLLLQNLTAVGDLGEHGCLRLRGADWNDALDMASENGESVAFSFAYAKNLRDLTGILARLKETRESVLLCEEILLLLPKDVEAEDAFSEENTKKRQNAYLTSCKKTVSGKKAEIPVDALIDCLLKYASALEERLQKQWLTVEGWGYFNSYYDNSKNRLEGFRGENDILRMMLTGQVFAVMSGVATDEQVEEIIKSADALLYDKDCGGYRLNTDFGEIKMDMGRLFGFAYGEKENGAVFSHMAVMYAYALYSRGQKEAGAKALFSLYDHAMDQSASCIYPGIPEYFDQRGRGLYHYLTGAASWYLMTMTTQVYGIRGEFGDLVLDEKLTQKLFGENQKTGISFPFGGRDFTATYIMDKEKAGQVYLNEKPVKAKIPRSVIEALPTDRKHEIVCYV